MREQTAPGAHPACVEFTRQNVFNELIPELQRAVAAEHYITPTPIQQRCIPHLLKGKDLLGTAQTGTGKTAAFCLPLLQRLAGGSRRRQKGTPGALILAPTRELAVQIDRNIRTYSRFLPIRHTVVFGGVNQFHQVKALNRGIDILTATPGRLLDLMRQGFVHLHEVNTFILDEADRMLDMGFIPDIKRVLGKIPAERQTSLFSATMPLKIVELTRAISRNPVRVGISPDKPTLDRIRQVIYFVSKEDKAALLISLVNGFPASKSLVFTRMKYTADKIVRKLGKAGIKGMSIHGNKSQAARTRALDGFRSGRFPVLVATDVASRGLDIDDITHVINYDLPMEPETYIHRIGRTARAGAAGDAISLCSARDHAYLKEIEHLLGKPIPVEMNHAFHCADTVHSRSPIHENSVRSGNKKSRRNNNFHRFRK